MRPVIKMKKKLFSSAALLLGTVIWGAAFIAQAQGMELLGPFTFQAARCAMAMLALLPSIVLFDGAQRKEGLKKWANPVLWKAGLPCGIALFAASSLQQVALLYTNAGKAGFITAMYIVIVPLIDLFFGEKSSFRLFVAVALAVVGLYMLSCAGVQEINRGDLLLMLCAVAFAVQIRLVGRFSSQVDALRLNAVQALVCGILSAGAMLLFEAPKMEHILQSWQSICFAGILSMGLAYSLQIIGQRELNATVASMIMSLESVFAALFGWLILHQSLSGMELTGCLLVFVGVIVSQLPAKHKMAEKSSV